jgi:hypothetical protein
MPPSSSAGRTPSVRGSPTTTLAPWKPLRRPPRTRVTVRPRWTGGRRGRPTTRTTRGSRSGSCAPSTRSATGPGHSSTPPSTSACSEKNSTQPRTPSWWLWPGASGAPRPRGRRQAPRTKPGQEPKPEPGQSPGAPTIARRSDSWNTTFLALRTTRRDCHAPRPPGSWGDGRRPESSSRSAAWRSSRRRSGSLNEPRRQSKVGESS